MKRAIILLLLSCLCACTAPKQAEESPEPKYTRTYRSETETDINMPEMEELASEEAPKAEPVMDEPEPELVAIAEEAEPEAVAQAKESEPVAEAKETEPVAQEEKVEPEESALPAWETEFIKDMEGIKEKKTERSHLTGDVVVTLPVGDEIQLGEAVAARMLAQTPELDDRTLWEYVTILGSVLAESSSRNDLPYHFVILDQPDEINAFAAPGGFIFITSGAIKACENEAELASLLAHEIAHVSLRHGISMLDLSKYRVLAKSMVSEMDEAFGKSEHYDLATSMPEELKKVEAALSDVADEAFQEMLNPFGREMEHEADAEGMRIMKATGYNPYAAIHLLERVAKMTGDGDAAPGMMALRSHPPTSHRIENLKRLAAERGYRDEGVMNRDRLQEYKKDL
jgi:predicted Zn-dependent protease